MGRIPKELSNCNSIPIPIPELELELNEKELELELHSSFQKELELNERNCKSSIPFSIPFALFLNLQTFDTWAFYFVLWCI